LYLALVVKAQAEPPRGLQSALFDSIAVHMRNLLAFLYKKRQKPDDIVATDFFEISDHIKWEADLGSIPPVLDDHHERANKQVGHITRSRVLAKRDWDLANVVFALGDVVRRFERATCEYGRIRFILEDPVETKPAGVLSMTPGSTGPTY
jgi:hypothetical protein